MMEMVTRTGRLLVDRFGCAAASHEAVIPARAAAILQDWRTSGIQHTPVLLFTESPLGHTPGDLLELGPLIVADGHHRLEAARRAADDLGRPLTIAAQVFSIVGGSPEIRPAHKVIWTAPDGWLERCRARLPAHSVSGRILLASRRLTGPEAARLIWRAAELDDPGVRWEIEGDEGVATARLADGAVGVIVSPALSIGDVVAAARSGELLPPRSTNFHPKAARLPSGFVLDFCRAPSDTPRQ